MTDITPLAARIDAEFAAATARALARDQQAAADAEDRARRLAVSDAAVERFCEHWRPRLEVLRDRFATLMKVAPTIKPHSREAVFAFAADRYSITLTFSAGPDRDVRNLIIEYDLRIIPMLIKYDSHHQLQLPIDQLDDAAVAQWLDARILDFVRTYVALQGDGFVARNLPPSSAS